MRKGDVVDEPYGEEDFVRMVEAIRRYAEEGLDQFDLFQLSTRWGQIYVSISMKPVGEASGDAYRRLRMDS